MFFFRKALSDIQSKEQKNKTVLHILTWILTFYRKDFRIYLASSLYVVAIVPLIFVALVSVAAQAFVADRSSRWHHLVFLLVSGLLVSTFYVDLCKVQNGDSMIVDCDLQHLLV